MSAALEFLSPPGMDAVTVAVLYATSFGTSFITAAFGLGGGVALIAVLASFLPPAALIPVHGVIQTGSNIFRALVMIKYTLWPVVLSFAVGSMIGIAIGGVLVVDLPGPVVQAAVALFIVWSIFAKPPAIMRKAAGLTGALSSFLTMFFGATGPFVAAYIKSLQLDRLDHIATHAVCMTIQHLSKCIVFGILGFAFQPYVGFMAIMIAFGFLGTLVGKQVLMKIDNALFTKVLNAIMLVLAARLLWSAWATWQSTGS